MRSGPFCAVWATRRSLAGPPAYPTAQATRDHGHGRKRDTSVRDGDRHVPQPSGVGLPAEQFAVEHGVHPRVTTESNITNMVRQLKALAGGSEPPGDLPADPCGRRRSGRPEHPAPGYRPPAGLRVGEYLRCRDPTAWTGTRPRAGPLMPQLAACMLKQENPYS